MAFPNLIEKINKLRTDVDTAQNTADSKAPISHASSNNTYGLGTASVYGHVKLSDAVNSTSAAAAGIAASPKAVKTAYDLANTANNAAAAAQNTADSALGIADSAMQTSGGTFTGNVTFKYDNGSVCLNVRDAAVEKCVPCNFPLELLAKSTAGTNYVNLHPFFLIPSDTNSYGMSVGFCGPQAIVVGGGEDTRNYVKFANTLSEAVYLLSDTNLYFVSNTQGITSEDAVSQAKQMVFNSSGNLVLPTGSTISGK